MLRLLPDVKFPVTPTQINPLLENVHQLNILEAGIHERFQKALGIFFHVIDTYCKTNGAVDYRGPEGHKRLVQDAMTFCGGSSIATKHGDLAAAHLGIDFHDTSIRLRDKGLPPLPTAVADLLKMCADFAALPPQSENRINLYLDFLGKKQN